jgi:arabinogalactan oligomer/maltooligosaccharide transport system permease protein
MKIQKNHKPFFMIVSTILVVTIAWILRWHAVTTLNVDYDEDDYLRAAQQYAALIRSGDWSGFLQTNYRPEHPPLAKIIFGFSILPAGDAPLIPDRPTSADPDQLLPKKQLHDARISGAIIGTLTVALVALLNPLAGLLLAVHSFTIKYVSQVMLEALPAFTSLVMVLCYLKGKKNGTNEFDGWMITSAIFLGLTAASKYIYCVIGVSLIIDWFLTYREKNYKLKEFLPHVLLWIFLGLVIFFAFDPYLWPAPLIRLKESIFHHIAYSAGASEVQRANLPFYQSLIYLSTSPVALGWQPSAFPVACDTLIAILAMIGIEGLWKKQRVYVLWLGVTLLFLFFWPTKWAQYILILTVPISISAAEGLSSITIRPLKKWLIRHKENSVRKTSYQPGDLRRALPWLVPGIIAFFIMTIFPIIFQFGVSLTNFSAKSIRDGFHGGLWRAIWGGLTGQIPKGLLSIIDGGDKVLYYGLAAYSPVINYITADGVLVFNILWTILSVLLQGGLGLCIALLLWQKGVRLGKFWQTIFILPWAIPEMIGALMWWNIFEPEWGWLSLAVEKYGPHIPFGFLVGWDQNPNLRLLVLLLPAIWYGFPFMMLAVSAGLKMIPSDVFDASAIDGASYWQTFLYIIWPLLMPMIIPAIIIRSIFSFNQFYLFLAFGSGSTLATLSYDVFINGGQYALSAVINIITTIILVGFVILLNRRNKIGEGVTYA